jgi:hypothetical protein
MAYDESRLKAAEKTGDEVMRQHNLNKTRGVFDSWARVFGVYPYLLDELWELSGVSPTDAPDERSIMHAVRALSNSKPDYFDPNTALNPNTQKPGSDPINQTAYAKGGSWDDYISRNDPSDTPDKIVAGARDRLIESGFLPSKGRS